MIVLLKCISQNQKILKDLVHYNSLHYKYLITRIFSGLKKYSFIPEPLQAKLLDKFTEHGPQGVSGTQRAFTQRMKDKVLAYLFVLALKVEGYTLNSAVLQKDLLVQSTK